MIDIHKQVRERLRELRLCKPEREEVLAEITIHLESVADEFVLAGLDEDEARQRALSQLDNPNDLIKQIQRERKQGMRDSFRKVWLPAAAVVLLTYVSQMVIYRFIAEPRAYHILGTYFAYSWGWLITVVCTGAFGAWWCRQVGGTLRQRLVVALAPAEAMAVVIVLVLPLGCLVELYVDRRIPYFVTHPVMTLAAMLWILHSAVPSLIGATPFLLTKNNGASEITS